ncbi:MAG: hypothetical protein COW85_10040 [Ignavibacteria bacterium CG22_combo_CG10-13_8_21_14_all_37_15]|nr:MAG: hypothetical protein COW85_10040 [Ignavibacteria bacterium CG22_combo_CG10-13_8_21_14_all_37_15]
MFKGINLLLLSENNNNFASPSKNQYIYSLKKLDFMAKVKNIQALCKFCNSVTKMELTGEVFSSVEHEGKEWAKCKKCKQILLIETDSIVRDSKHKIDQIILENSIDYSPEKTFSVGDTIYHKTWDDFGIVISKLSLSNGKGSITVEFQKLGFKKLLETH